MGIHRLESAPATLPVSVLFEDAHSELETKMEAQTLNLRDRLALNPEATSRWGTVELPADGGPLRLTGTFTWEGTLAGTMTGDLGRLPVTLGYAAHPEPDHADEECVTGRVAQGGQHRRIPPLGHIDHALQHGGSLSRR